MIFGHKSNGGDRASHIRAGRALRLRNKAIICQSVSEVWTYKYKHAFLSEQPAGCNVFRILGLLVPIDTLYRIMTVISSDLVMSPC